MYSIIFVQAKLSVTGSDLQGQFLIVVEAHVLVSAELEIRPFLVDLLLLAIHDLLDLLRLLMGLEELPGADSLRIAILFGAPRDDVENGGNIFGRPFCELVDA